MIYIQEYKKTRKEISMSEAVNSVGASATNVQPQLQVQENEPKIGTIELVKRAASFSGLGLMIEQAETNKELVETAVETVKEHSDEIKGAAKDVDNFAKEHPALACLLSPVLGLVNLFR